MNTTVIAGALLTIWAVSYAVLSLFSKRLALSLPSLSQISLTSVVSVLIDPVFLGVLVFNGICALAYLLSLRFLPLSVGGPLFVVTGACTATLIGAFAFAERVGPTQLAGLGLCLVGALLLNLGR